MNDSDEAGCKPRLPWYATWRSHDLAPVAGQILCGVEEIPEGRCKEIRYGEGIYAFSLLVHRSRGQVKVYVNRCPHFSLPLNVRPGEFVMLEGERVMCALHGAVFRLDNGHCEAGPAASSALESVEVVVRDGLVCIADGECEPAPDASRARIED
jgi:nitrite reductase/ring-hydroxylating ferredoxin subunit